MKGQKYPDLRCRIFQFCLRFSPTIAYDYNHVNCYFWSSRLGSFIEPITSFYENMPSWIFDMLLSSSRSTELCIFMKIGRYNFFANSHETPYSRQSYPYFWNHKKDFLCKKAFYWDRLGTTLDSQLPCLNWLRLLT